MMEDNIRLNPVEEKGITDPLVLTHEVCRIFMERDKQYMYYGIREYVKWMRGEYNDWFFNYSGDDDFLPGLAMSLSAFYYPTQEDHSHMRAAEMAFKYLSRHYWKKRYLPDLYLFYYLMFRFPYKPAVLEFDDGQTKLQGYCLKMFFDYQNRQYLFPKDGVLPSSIGSFQREIKLYEKYVINGHRIDDMEMERIIIVPMMTPEEYRDAVIDCMQKHRHLSRREKKNLLSGSIELWEQYKRDFLPEVCAYGIESGLI